MILDTLEDAARKAKDRPAFCEKGYGTGALDYVAFQQKCSPERVMALCAVARAAENLITRHGISNHEEIALDEKLVALKELGK